MPSEPAFWELHLALYFAQSRMKNRNSSPWCVNWCSLHLGQHWHWHPKSMEITYSTWSVELLWASCTPFGDCSYFCIKKQLARYLLKGNSFERTKNWEVLECDDIFIMFMLYILYTQKFLQTGSKVKKVSVKPSIVLNYLWMSFLVCKIWSYFWRLFENLPHNLNFGVTITSNIWMLIT